MTRYIHLDKSLFLKIGHKVKKLAAKIRNVEELKSIFGNQQYKILTNDYLILRSISLKGLKNNCNLTKSIKGLFTERMIVVFKTYRRRISDRINSFNRFSRFLYPESIAFKNFFIALIMQFGKSFTEFQFATVYQN